MHCGPERAAIEVTHLHRWCLDYLSFRGVGNPKYSPELSRRLRYEAPTNVAPAHQNALKSVSHEHLWTAVDFLMKRFLHDDIDVYLTMDRSRRRRDMSAEQRLAILDG